MSPSGSSTAPEGAGSHVLALNSGSSSLKFGLYRVDSTPIEAVLTGEAQSIGESRGTFVARDSRNHRRVSEDAPLPSQREAVERIGRLLDESGVPAPLAIGHRIVHGGPKLRRHCVIDDLVFQEIQAASAFAPLHTPSALSVIQFAREHFPGIAQAACFDTAFHADLPDVARVLPLPKDLQSQGVQRYGFHGLSYESIVHQLADDLPRRLVVAHLGNGASVTAIDQGRSVDTTMSMTPTGGLIMGTRSGDLDPGVLLYLLRTMNMDADALEGLVDHRSGLLGISRVSSDMRRLHEAAASNADARLAIEMFCYSARKQVAGMIAALGGVDMLVFTGGIGENDAEVRSKVCAGLTWAGVSLDEVRNRAARTPISDAASRCWVTVLPSQEDEQIARHTLALLI